MNSKVTTTIYGDIEYVSIGAGIPVVFLHGGHSNCFDTLAHKGFDLSKYNLITPSRPGYGLTPVAGNNTARKAADLIIDLLDFLEIETAIFYGISAGGPTAIEIAANYPEKVKKLILASAVTMPWLDKNERTYKIAKKFFNPSTESFIWGMVRTVSGIFPKLLARNFYRQFSLYPGYDLRAEDVKELINLLGKYHSKNGFMIDIDQDISDETISRIYPPTLVIHSRNDNSVSIDHALNAAEKIRGSQLEMLNNEWGHILWIGPDADDTIDRIIEFIEK